MGTSAYTDYGIGVYQMNGIQFRVAVVTYDGNCYSHADISQIQEDWLAEQAAIPLTLSDVEQQVVDLTNQERAKYGLAPLSTSDDMQKAAKVRVGEAAVSYNHIRPNGQAFESVYTDIRSTLSYEEPRLGFPVVVGEKGENLAGGVYTPETVVSGWMGSSGHRKNILNPDFTHIGVSLEPRIVNGRQQGYYWVQCFLGVSP